MIDLHCHSCFSDGTDTPEELVAQAIQSGVKGLALTDHDTVAGVPRFAEAAAPHGITAVAGVEISTAFRHGDLHMLGYFVDHQDSQLAEKLEWIRSGRRARNDEIFHKLHQLGMPLTWPEIAGHTEDRVIGRPHFAQAMVARGYVHNTKEAFTRYLARGGSAYAARRTLAAEDALAIICDAGGVPVLAHPVTLPFTRRELRDALIELKRMGLAGLEVYYPQHNPEHTRFYAQLARELDLIPTGGSDYHGTRTPDLQLGRGFGTLKVPANTIDRLSCWLPIP